MAGIDKSQGKFIFPPRFVPYLEKHRIFELFHELTELLVQEMPKDHVRFLKEMLPCAAKRRDKPRIVFWTPPTFDREGFAREIADVLHIMEITRYHLEVKEKKRILMTNLTKCSEMKFYAVEEENMNCMCLPEYFGECEIPKIPGKKFLAESETSEIPEEEKQEEKNIEDNQGKKREDEEVEKKPEEENQEEETEEEKEKEKKPEEKNQEEEKEEDKEEEKKPEEENQEKEREEEDKEEEKKPEEENQEKEKEEDKEEEKKPEEENQEEEKEEDKEEEKKPEEENQEEEKEEDKEEEITVKESDVDKDPCKGFRVCPCKKVQLLEELGKETDESESNAEKERNKNKSDDEKIRNKIEYSVNEISKCGSDFENNSLQSKTPKDNFNCKTSDMEPKISKEDFSCRTSDTEAKISKEDFSCRTSDTEAKISKEDFSCRTSNTEAKISKENFSCKTNDTEAKTEKTISSTETSCTSESSLGEVFIDYGVLGKCEYAEKGWILVDFPKDAEEAEHLCAKGALPTHAIHLIADTEEEKTRQYKYMSKDWKTVYQSVPVMDIHINKRSNAELAKDICSLLRVMPHRHAPMLPRVVLIGCRGSGATTQAKLLSRKYKMVHVEFQEAIAQALLQDDNLNERYKLQKLTRPDPELEAAILERILLTPPCRKRGWVLTGYPTTIDQMYMLDIIATPPNRIIFIEVPAKECFIRLYYRKTDWTDGKEYKLPHIEPSGLEARDALGIDPEVAKRLLSHPKDDKRQIIHDIEKFFDEKETIMKYCGRTAAYVNGNKSIDTVFELIDQIIFNPAPAESARDPLTVNYGIQEAYQRFKNIRLEGGIIINNMLKNPPDPPIKF